MPPVESIVHVALNIDILNAVMLDYKLSDFSVSGYYVSCLACSSRAQVAKLSTLPVVTPLSERRLRFSDRIISIAADG